MEVAVARKLTILLHRLWLTAEVYEPLYKPTKTVPLCQDSCRLLCGDAGQELPTTGGAQGRNP